MTILLCFVMFWDDGTRMFWDNSIIMFCDDYIIMFHPQPLPRESLFGTLTECVSLRSLSNNQTNFCHAPPQPTPILMNHSKAKKWC